MARLRARAWLLILVGVLLASPVAASGAADQTEPDPAVRTEPGSLAQATDPGRPNASASFSIGSVDRDDNGNAALGGVIATIEEYAGADSVRIIYYLPEQDVVLYESARYPVEEVKQAGPLAPGQRDPERQANQLMASHIEQNLDTDREFAPQEDEQVILQFYDDGTQFDEITYVVGSGQASTGSDVAGDGAPGDRQSRRGFFTNGGDGPEVLSNVFNLTVLGFLLSVAGIVYQMTNE